VSDRGARIVARGARFNGPLAGSVRAPGVPLVKRGSESRSVCQTGHASCGSTTRGVCERGNSGSEHVNDRWVNVLVVEIFFFCRFST
jgi:hypothetical protein